MSDSSLDETFLTLSDLAHRKLGPISPAWAAAQIVTAAPDADFRVRAAALEALIRRHRSALRDELRIVARPRRGTLGRYAVGRTNGEMRPYAIELWGVAPLRASCGCADFVRSSLGICKHVLTVLGDIVSRGHFAEEGIVTSGSIGWASELPLHGSLDRLGGLRFIADLKRAPAGWVLAPPDPRAAFAELWERVVKGASARCIDRRAWAPDVAALTDLKLRKRFLQSGLSRLGAPLEPAAQTIAAEELERVERLLSADAVLERASAQALTVKRTLYPYQLEGVRRFFERKRLLLADDMGLGKTTQAITACHALYKSRVIRRGILIVPASLKSQWAREWADTTELPLTVVDGTPAERAAQYAKLERGFLVIGYEQLLKDFEQVAGLAPELVVLDEAQRIKNFASKTAVYVKALKPEYRLVLTGTPMENRLTELASVLDWVDDLACAPKWRLDPLHTFDTSDEVGGEGPGGARHLDTLRLRLRASVVRRRRQEVLSQLPKRSDTRVPVPMTPLQIAEHDELNRPIAQLMAIAKRRSLTPAEHLKLMSWLAKQRVISNGLAQLRFDETWPRIADEAPTPAVLEGLFAPKLAELRRLVEELAVRQNRKIVIFSQWRRMLKLSAWAVRDVLEAAGVRSVFFTGGESQKQRTQSVVELHDDPDTRVMFLSDAGGVGLNLQRAASACINLETPWNPAVLEQRIGRIYRLGQKRPIDIYNLVSEYGIETRISQLVANKQAVFKGLFDGDTDEVTFVGRASLVADVEKLIPAAPVVSAGVSGVDLALVEESGGNDEADAGSEIAGESLPADTLPVEPTAPRPPAADVAKLFSQLDVHKTADGGVRIEAPPEAAAALVALLSGLAKMISAAAER